MSKNTLTCKYIFKDDYNPKYVNGAQGGINSSGDIVINFYLERNALPNSESLLIGKDGKIIASEHGDVDPPDLRNSFVRVIENGVVMNYNFAKEFQKWLGNHIETLEKLNSQK